MPSWRSRRAICWEIAGWVNDSAVAASENEPRVATSRKTESRRASNITAAYQPEKRNIIGIYPGRPRPSSHDLHRLPHHPSRHRRRRGGPHPPRRPRLQPRPQRRAARRRARRQPRRRALGRHRRRHRRPLRAHRRHRRLDARPGRARAAPRARRSSPATSAAPCSGGRSRPLARGALRQRKQLIEGRVSRRRVGSPGREFGTDRARSRHSATAQVGISRFRHAPLRTRRDEDAPVLKARSTAAPATPLPLGDAFARARASAADDYPWRTRSR